MNRLKEFFARLSGRDTNTNRYITSRRVFSGEVLIEELRWDKEARTISIPVIEDGIPKTFVVETVIDMILDNPHNLIKLRGGFVFDRNLYGTHYLACADNDPAYDEIIEVISEYSATSYPSIPGAYLYIYMEGENFELRS
jgi:hypothetical protein